MEMEFDYATRRLPEDMPVRKQAVKRHYGVHGYFTKQSWNVVAEYIKNFSKPGDLVLDPYCGSGVTAIEAMMNGRRAISVDLNPLSIFMVSALIAPVEQIELNRAFEEVVEEYKKYEPKTEEEIEKVLRKYPWPKNLKLPKGSSVDTVIKLFSKKQMASLLLLKSIILKQQGHRHKDKNIRDTLLLMFSGLVTRVNLTSYAKKEGSKGNGNTTIFQYYRYALAKDPVEVDLMKYFELRYKRVSEAKKEMECFINDKTLPDIRVVKGTAVDLSFLACESIDYIYTDPPYAKKIPYLDLSVMWHAWLDLEVTEEDYKKEVIEGGEHKKSKEEYKNLMARSIKEMYRVLKFDRWLSFVFAHKDPEFWDLIVETACSCGFEYVGVVSQNTGRKSFKKIQNPQSALTGQLILNFRKVRNPKVIRKAKLDMDISDKIVQITRGVIEKNNGATLEQINDELIIKGLELGFLNLLQKEYTDITKLLREHVCQRHLCQGRVCQGHLCQRHLCHRHFEYDEKRKVFKKKKWDGDYKEQSSTELSSEQSSTKQSYKEQSYNLLDTLKMPAEVIHG